MGANAVKKGKRTMANLMDYLDWRGDLLLENAPFNEVDNLILAELSFLDFTGIVGDGSGGGSIALKDAVDAWFLRHEGELPRMGVLVPAQIIPMADKMRRSRRFADMRLDCYRSVLDTQNEVQFAALTIDMGSTGIYMAFRGTDDTLVGWKEDFNMAFLPQIPSQKMAAEYVKEVAARYPRRRIYLGGHSKGGNLTVYAAVHCGSRIQRRIVNAFSNDGPGFKEPMAGRAEYEAIRDRIVSIVPQSSVVGMLLEHEEAYTVVQSCQQGLYQHDGFSWEVMGPGFIHLDAITAEGRSNEAAVRAFLAELDDAQRQQFVDALFDILGSSNAQTLTELESGGVKAWTNMVKSYKDLSKESRQTLISAVKVLLKAGGENLLEEIEEKRQELRKLLKLEK